MVSFKPLGTPTERTFATEEYEGYAQDSCRIRPNLWPRTMALAGSLTSTPVYEKNGLQVVPNVNLGYYFNRRVESANNGVPFTVPISFILGGKGNNAPGYYKQDWNNFAPTVAVAWASGPWRQLVWTLVWTREQERHSRWISHDLRPHWQSAGSQFRSQQSGRLHLSS